VLHKQEPVFGDSIPPTPQVMNRYSSALAQSLGGGLQIIGELNADTPGELMIVFRPLGDRLRISEVNFTGNVVVPTPELWRVINEVAIGAPYSEPLFRQMLDSSIRALYEDRGRLRVAFPKIETVKSTENEGVVVAVVIDEGEVFTLGEVSYAGVPASSELNKLGGWIKGQPLIASEINVGLGRIRKSFREDGYLRVTSDLVRTFNDQAHTVDLTITITPGARYTMGKLSIVGLDIISEPAIRKLWRLNQGDSYRESYPDSFLAMIQAEGYFDNLARTGAQADLHDDSHRVDVTLNFLGAKAAAEADRKRP
jgi:outer membrane protein assembly factor BamA